MHLMLKFARAYPMQSLMMLLSLILARVSLKASG